MRMRRCMNLLFDLLLQMFHSMTYTMNLTMIETYFIISVYKGIFVTKALRLARSPLASRHIR